MNIISLVKRHKNNKKLNRKSAETSNVSENNLDEYELVMLQGNTTKTFVPVFEQNQIYYGGNQKWFNKEFYRDRGCGTVAAANIAWYMSKNISGCEALYTKEDISMDNFTEHMNEILTFVKPCLLGVPTVYNLGRGMASYARSKGVNLKIHYKPWRMDSSKFVKEGLKLDSPVAMLQYYRKQGFNWHWQTITKYYKNIKTNEEYIETSSWSRQYSFNFKPFKGNKFVYFTLC
ncbi:hypothetical protein GOQ29_05470 [Clostridium sp. D2Q-14]|uniref:hypothetical protein n=1 Tax=Anaeromonas gelatinilytica TaxID=2683194 RepID=UPI00193B63B9|nr:hypothetical protein [Anaeromonas gelatinilytica]MBS4535068.1 hypothetical protein [Anaeromonas gelatinilytica]